VRKSYSQSGIHDSEQLFYGCLVPISIDHRYRLSFFHTQHSSGGKDRLASISKQGDRYLRSLFVAGALAVIRYAKIDGGGRPRSPPSRLPTSLPEWPGP
jgi:hypothetical protein